MKNNALNIIKEDFSQRLIKVGSNLDEFEKDLSENKFTEKYAGVILDTLHELLKGGLNAGFTVAAKAPEILMGGTVLAGTALGSTAYGLDKHLSGQDKKHNEKQQIIDKYKELTERTMGDHGLLHPYKN